MIEVLRKGLFKAIAVLDVVKVKANRDTNSQEGIQAKRCVKWFEINGDETLRLDYPLNYDSVVFDVGGYKGEFARDIYCKYNCNIFVFEPVVEFFYVIKNRFIKNNRVKVFNYGLGRADYLANISLEDNSSSLFKSGKSSTEIEIRSINTFLINSAIQKVDLIKINIEGGEYDLLESILEMNNVTKFYNIQVQFHDFVLPDAKERMERIQKKLSITHSLTYQYEFVWENWRLKDGKDQ